MNPPGVVDKEGEVRVLVVDDNRDAAESLCQLLEILGCQTAMAFDGRHGLQACRSFDPQVAFIDMDMPGMDGCELVRELRLQESIPRRWLLCLTGRREPETEKRCLEAGFDRFFTKPIDMDALIKVLDSVQEP